MEYKTFLKSLTKLLGTMEDNIVNDEQRVTNLQAAWTTGRDVFLYKQSTGMTTKQIADDVGIPSQSMDKFVRVYRYCPEGIRDEIEGHPLTWSHYVAVMYVHVRAARDFYLREAAVNGWSSHELRVRIRNNYYENRVAAARAGKKALVLKTPDQRLYTYGARVLKVTDADTLLLNIDVGFKSVMEHKVRLRGINCAEVKSVLGEKARAFVRERLLSPEGEGERVVIRTYKSGKFGRYIVDVWYLPGEASVERILQEGRFLNQELLDEGLAVLVE